MVFMFGIHTRRKPIEPDVVQLGTGDIHIGDLVPVVGGCPRYPGDECDLVGGYHAVVVQYGRSLFYKVVA